MPTATMVGRARGMAIPAQTRSAPAPSSRADSKTSIGMRRKVQRKSRTKKGDVPPRAGTTSASRESSSPASLKSTKRGSQTAVTGIISTANDMSVRASRARCGSCDMANPAREATRIVNGTASTTTNAELSALCPIPARSNRRRVVVPGRRSGEDLELSRERNADLAQRRGEHEHDRRQEERGRGDRGEKAPAISRPAQTAAARAIRHRGIPAASGGPPRTAPEARAR